MKKNFYTVVFFSIFLSCGSNTKSNHQDTLAHNANKIDNSAKGLLKRFGPFINGFWVKKDYVESIIKTKSPRQSYSKANGMVAIIINRDSVKGDSMTAAVGWENHEGGELVLKLKTGQMQSALKTTLVTVEDNPGDFYELGYRVVAHDTNVIVYHYNKQKKLIRSDLYMKDLPEVGKPSELSDVGYRRVNQALVTGVYSALDSIGQPLKIKMDNEGNITGFNGFKSYAVNIDFAEGYRENLDEIWFDPFDNKKRKAYAFKIKRDTIKLYDTSLNADSTELILGKLKYNLIKQK